MAGSVTALAKLGIGAADPVNTALQFAVFDPNVVDEQTDTNATRGTFFKDSNRILQNRIMVTPRFSSEPTAPEMAVLLEWIMGGTPTGTTTKTYPWSDTPLARYLHFKPKAGEEWFISQCAVDNALMQASVGGALGFDIDGVAIGYDDTRTNFPSLTYDQTLQPFILSQLALTVAGVDRKPRSISMQVIGGIDRDRYLNSRNLTALQRVNGGFMFSFEVPSGDNAAGFWKAGVDDVAGSAVFTNASTGAVLTWDIPAMRWAPTSPTHEPGGEGFIRINALPVRVSTATPITITLNPGA